MPPPLSQRPCFPQVRSPPLARTTVVIFQLVLLQGGVWVGGEGYPLREPLSELGRVAGPWPGCSSSLLGLHRWFSERARPLMPGCERGHPALGSPATPLRRGVPETFGGLAEAGRERKLSCRNDENCLLKKLPFKKENEKEDKMGFVTEQKDTRRRASD